MGLSRLDNFLKNTRGEILYVDPSNADSTDSVENRGNSLTRPFKTIQRALIEASRFSYQRGLDNDRFGKTTIMLYPGEHIIDNRPGWIPLSPNGGSFRTRSGETSTDFLPFDLTTNFDINSENNALYKFNSVHGGVIVPRGTSLVGLDLRKTKIRPKYIPDPRNSNIERAAIFRLTGICYMWQFSVLDADPNGSCFKDYTRNSYVPNFSHHKLTAFEYADGVNAVEIDDTFLTYSTTKTDLDLYYEKIGIAYGPSSGRDILPESTGSPLDIQPKIDEFRIVGSKGGDVGITSIKAGNGVSATNVITVTLEPNDLGLDLRKTKIRPKYIPDPRNSNIERAAIFRLTGICYMWQFSVLDADPNGSCFKDYTRNSYVPNFSHHKLTAFEYADGVNAVEINDTFLTYSTTKTDLDLYYEKIGIAYGPSSGREVPPETAGSPLDIQPKIDEFRIGGSKGGDVGITSIKAGDGVSSTNVITVTLQPNNLGLDVDTPIRIEGVNSTGYDGQYVISEVVSSTEIKYQVSSPPGTALPSVTGSTLNISVDTVTSASPYVFNISLRSVYGMCGLHADGNKADGFKSMVVAQFTGIGLQKDDNAFVKYNATSGLYEDNTVSGNENIHTDSLARFKPEYENYHIKVSNDSFIQVVSVFAIGYALHFVAETGGDLSITNSNSNFGSKALASSGFRHEAFPRDDVGYITHIIPPKEFEVTETTLEFASIDVEKTVGVASTNRLYLYNETNPSVPPDNVIDGYRIGAKSRDSLEVLISHTGITTQHSARIIMPNTEFSGNEITAEKSYQVDISGGSNSISSNIITLTSSHSLKDGETVRVLSSTGQLPDGIHPNQVYYAITTGLSANQLKLAQTLNDALNGSQISINNKGGFLTVVSRVSDKNSGDIGHPIQFDTNQNQWYINVGTAATDNAIYPSLVGLGTTNLGQATPRTFIVRQSDSRPQNDSIYRVRYVIPKNASTTARPPSDGFIIQESSSTIGATNTEIAYQFNPSSVTLPNVTNLRNQKIIANATWDGTNANIITELPHELNVGSQVKIVNVTSTANVTGVANSAYNGTFTVSGISSSKHFSFAAATDPGTFTNNTSNRTSSLPYFVRKRYNDTYVIQRTQEVKRYIKNEQDGIYYLTLLNASNSPNVAPFNNLRFIQPIANLYPQLNRDNLLSDPSASVSYALPDTIGQVVIDEPQHSVTRETVEKIVDDFGVGIGITNIRSNPTGTAHTIFTSIDHGLNRVTGLTVVTAGSGYGTGIGTEYFYGAKLVGEPGTGQNATARIKVNAGAITEVKIMDGGSAFGVGTTLAVVGVATTTSYSVGVVSVTSIYNNADEIIRVGGISSVGYKNYNTLYRISGVTPGNSKQVEVVPISTISPISLSGIGQPITANAHASLVGKAVGVSSLTYNPVTGVGVITTTNNHGFNVNNVIALGGATNSLYNDSFAIKKVNSLTSFTIHIGIGTTAPAGSGTIYAFRRGAASNAGAITVNDENIGGRLYAKYDKVSTNLSANITGPTVTTITIPVTGLDLNVGDYLEIGNEIVRIKTTVTSDVVSVYRGVLGTPSGAHPSGTTVRRIKPFPVELRRHSIIRASGHTFEYVGYGPGNYSTAFPDRQDRQISSQEELLSQSFKNDGGINLFSGLNDKGISYSGNKKLSTITAQEEIFDTPIQTITGEDISKQPFLNVINPIEGNFSNSIKVEGGPSNKVISKFDGPVVFTNKITSTSTKGLEASSLFLQGDATISRKYTVGVSTPTNAGNPGDVVYRATPESGGTAGWIYTSDNNWRRFGPISTSTSATNIVVNQVNANSFIGTFSGDGSGLSNVSDIWRTDAIGIHTQTAIGIGTTSAKAGFGLYVEGSTSINGTLRVFEIIETATITSGILTTTSVQNIDLGDNNVYYFTTAAQGNWTLNFRGNSSQTLNDFLTVGESTTVAVITTQGSTPYYNSTVQIDGVTQSVKYYGGVPITSGNASGIDVYTYVIIKTAANTYTVLYSQSQYS